MLRYHVHLWYFVIALTIFSASKTKSSRFNNYHSINNDDSNVNKLNQIPTYYIDLKVLDILKRRIKCLFNSSSTNHILHTLKKQSATEFHRSHELYAYNFFVESIDNPYRRFNYDDADFEYIPLLPLHWLHAYNSSSKNDDDNNNNRRCGGYKSFIQDIITIQEYFRERDNNFNYQHIHHISSSSSSSSSRSKVISKFTVASTYNLRTAIGVGMPTQIRRGYAWTTVSEFIMSLSLGHYERWPQCPDLLRKTFTYTIELPYVSMTTTIMITTSDIKATDSDNVFDKRVDDDGGGDDKLIKSIRPYLFHFSGNFELFGPELICSVRNSIIDISNRADVFSINVTQIYAKFVGVDRRLMPIISNSTFCLVTKGDSYSTSFFYHAIQLGCIPIVISDWFVFSFPWIIPYDQFILRVSENDFLKNPHYVLDYIKSSIGMNDKLLHAMRINMMKYKGLLSYDRISLHSMRHVEMLRLDQYYSDMNYNNEVKSNRTIFRTILPMELLLLEMKYSQYPHQYYNNIPCTRPNRCSDNAYHHSYLNEHQSDHRVRSSRQRLNNITDYQFIESKQKQPSHISMYLSNFTTNHIAAANDILYPVYKVKNEGYQVNPLSIPPTISNVFNTNYDIINNFIDIRSHLCRHNTRLIGMYKMVYYMQCVRILWPLQPGKFKPVDNISGRIFYSHTDNQYHTIEHGNNSHDTVMNPDIKSNDANIKHRGKLRKSSSVIYRYDPYGISIQDMLFVTAYHDANQSKYMTLTNYPINSDSLDHIYQLYSSRISSKVKVLELD